MKKFLVCIVAILISINCAVLCGCDLFKKTSEEDTPVDVSKIKRRKKLC